MKKVTRIRSDDRGVWDKSLNDHFKTDLEHLLNKWSIESASNTPDWILAVYLINCLKAWNTATAAREKWYGRDPKEVE